MCATASQETPARSTDHFLFPFLSYFSKNSQPDTKASMWCLCLYIAAALLLIMGSLRESVDQCAATTAIQITKLNHSPQSLGLGQEV